MIEILEKRILQRIVSNVALSVATKDPTGQPSE